MESKFSYLLSTVASYVKSQCRALHSIWLQCTGIDKYLQRHNNAFKILFFEVFRSLDLITKVEPWFSEFTPKPLYENEHATAFWDVPLFADTTQVKANGIDAKVIDKTSKQVRVIEMSCPWLENRESKDSEKTTKHNQPRLDLTNRYPESKVNQYNIIMDVLGGCSKEVEKNIKELVGDKCESIMRQMQKAILSSSLHIARMFKLSAQISTGILDTYFNRYLILYIIEILFTYLRRSHN